MYRFLVGTLLAMCVFGTLLVFYVMCLLMDGVYVAAWALQVVLMGLAAWGLSYEVRK